MRIFWTEKQYQKELWKHSDYQIKKHDENKEFWDTMKKVDEILKAPDLVKEEFDLQQFVRSIVQDYYGDEVDDELGEFLEFFIERFAYKYLKNQNNSDVKSKGN